MGITLSFKVVSPGDGFSTTLHSWGEVWGWHRRQKGPSVPQQQQLCTHHWELSSPALSIRHLSPPLSELLKFQGSCLFVYLLLMFGHFFNFFFFSFWVLKGPLLSKCWWDQKGLLCHFKHGPQAAGLCSLPLLSTELLLEAWGVPRTLRPWMSSDPKDQGRIEGELSENWQATCRSYN